MNICSSKKLFAWGIETMLEDFSIWMEFFVFCFWILRGIKIVGPMLVSLDAIMGGIGVSGLKLGCRTWLPNP